jgi:hypothetical protein
MYVIISQLCYPLVYWIMYRFSACVTKLGGNIGETFRLKSRHNLQAVHV